MTFIPERRIENRASELWRRHGLQPGFDVEALVDKLELGLLWDDLPHDVLGALKPSDGVVILNQLRLPDFDANPGLLRFTVAHEIGHSLLHAAEARSGTLPMLGGDRTWCRESSRDSRDPRPPAEIQADLFASFMLMPTDRLRPVLPPDPWKGWPAVYSLAEKFAVTASAMIVRLERAGWAHRDAEGVPRSGRAADTSGQMTLPVT